VLPDLRFRYGLTDACDSAPPMRSPPWASHLAAPGHRFSSPTARPPHRTANSSLPGSTPPNPHVTPSFSCPRVLATARLFSPHPHRALVRTVGACNPLSGEPSFSCWAWPWPVTWSGRSSVLPARRPVRSSWCAPFPPSPPWLTRRVPWPWLGRSGRAKELTSTGQAPRRLPDCRESGRASRNA